MIKKKRKKKQDWLGHPVQTAAGLAGVAVGTAAALAAIKAIK